MSEVISKKKINNLVVHAAPKMGGEDKRPPRGKELFDKPFNNIYYSAKKNTGKTSNIFFTLQHIMGPKTKLIIFCSTVHKDASWLYIVDYFEKKGNQVATFTSLKEGKDDLLKKLLNTLENGIDEDNKPKKEEVQLTPKQVLQQKGAGVRNAILNHNIPVLQEAAGKKKPKKSKYRERKYIIVLDDLSTELKTPSLEGLLKKNRHFHMDVLLSSQYYLDIHPGSRKQIDYFLLYRGQTEEKLEAIYKDADIPIEYDEFKELYKDATTTGKPWSFLYVDVRHSEFRQDYNIEYEI